jgi:hypothetical protein
MKNGNKQREKRREYARSLPQELWPNICSECLEEGKHFVPPSLGEAGFFICQVPDRVEYE